MKFKIGDNVKVIDGIFIDKHLVEEYIIFKIIDISDCEPSCCLNIQEMFPQYFSQNYWVCSSRLKKVSLLKEKVKILKNFFNRK